MQRGSAGIILLIILALMALVGGFYYFNFKQKEDELVKNQVVISQKTITPTYTPGAIENYTRSENLGAISGDFKLSYFYDPGDNKQLILRQIDFKTNKSKDTTLPYLTINNSNENKRGRYLVSPSEKYIIKMTNKKLEIAELANSQSPVFKTVHIVSEMKSSGPVPNSEADFASMKDAIWDENGKLYFISDVGADGFTSPFGYFTDLYIANEDGSNKRLINDHTKENQKIGFMRSLMYVDAVKKEIYLGGQAHGGHNAVVIVIDAESGTTIRDLRELFSDLSEPVFNKDFSKAFYEKSLKYEDGYHPTQIYEYDMATNAKKLLYSLPDSVDDNSPQINEYLYGRLYLNQVENKLYFQVEDGQTGHFYAFDLTSGGQPKLLFDDDGSCMRQGVSANGEYILLFCQDKKGKNSKYQFYQVSSGKRQTFYSGDAIIGFINFE